MDKGVYVCIEFLIDKATRQDVHRSQRHTRYGLPLRAIQEPEECNLTVTVYPPIEAKTLGLPYILGKFNLKPITIKFRIIH